MSKEAEMPLWKPLRGITLLFTPSYGHQRPVRRGIRAARPAFHIKVEVGVHYALLFDRGRCLHLHRPKGASHG